MPEGKDCDGATVHLKAPQKGFGGLAADGNNVYAQWIHNNASEGAQQIFFAASQDSGVTWQCSESQQLPQRDSWIG